VNWKTMVSTKDIGLEPDHVGKVRDIFDLGDRLLLVASDRISAYDVVMSDPVPGKGVMLTQFTLAWYEVLGGDAGRQLITADASRFPEPFASRAEDLAGRSMLVHKAKRFDVECIVRGYLAGSGWKEYGREGAIAGLPLPPDLQESEELRPPLFTPTTKAEEGHDLPLRFEQVEAMIGPEAARAIREKSTDYYTRAREHARPRGILIADTKFEFGLLEGEIVVIDEMLSPDSSRFWPAEDYEPGRTQTAFDKQFLRDHLDVVGWDRAPPPPSLPREVVERTRDRYLEALERLFGRERRRAFAAGDGDT
jgi:phosphoribosylaminoimidazole-succinocarboxamide synthase